MSHAHLFAFQKIYYQFVHRFYFVIDSILLVLLSFVAYLKQNVITSSSICQAGHNCGRNGNVLPPSPMCHGSTLNNYNMAIP